MPLTFAGIIAPLFRQGDIKCMAKAGVLLSDPNYMCDAAGNPDYPDHANARSVFEQLSTKNMPPDQPWPDANIALFNQWMTDGFNP